MGLELGLTQARKVHHTLILPLPCPLISSPGSERPLEKVSEALSSLLDAGAALYTNPQPIAASGRYYVTEDSC